MTAGRLARGSGTAFGILCLLAAGSLLFLCDGRAHGQTPEPSAATPAANSGAPPSAAATPSATNDDVQDLVYLAPAGPIVIRLHLRIDGVPLAEFRRLAARRIFDSLDADGNGVLEGKELDRIPPPDLLAAAARKRPGSPADGSRPKGASVPAGRVTPEEFSAYLLSVVGNTFALEINSGAKPARNGPYAIANGDMDVDRVDLMAFLSVLDADGDGRLTTAECEKVENVLRLLDLNDDETVSRAEIAQVAASKKVMGNGGSARLGGLSTRLVAVDRYGSRRDLGRKLLDFYGPASQERKAQGQPGRPLTAAELGVSPEALARYDANQDGRLDETELAAWLADPAPQFELDVALPKKSLDNPTVRVRPASTGAASAPSSPSPASSGPGGAPSSQVLTVKAGEEGTAVLRIGQIPIELRAAESPPKPVSRKGYYKSVFRRADRDMNGYLVPRELGGTELGLSPQDFGAIDRDHNQMIFENEWLAFMELYDTLAEHRVTLTLTAAADDPVTPFDSNHDGRLSRGELARALATIRSWDVNGDGQISPEEVPQRFEGLFHLGALGSPAKAEMMPGMRRSEPPPASDAPAWFQRMDRNRDGEVSFREFLGPISVFRRLDTNHDGALDAEEARRAK